MTGSVAGVRSLLVLISDEAGNAGLCRNSIPTKNLWIYAPKYPYWFLLPWFT